MISEGSYDTEDWINEENTALNHRNKLHVKIDLTRKQFFLNCNNISKYYCFTIFVIK